MTMLWLERCLCRYGCFCSVEIDWVMVGAPVLRNTLLPLKWSSPLKLTSYCSCLLKFTYFFMQIKEYLPSVLLSAREEGTWIENQRLIWDIICLLWTATWLATFPAGRIQSGRWRRDFELLRWGTIVFCIMPVSAIGDSFIGLPELFPFQWFELHIYEIYL